MATPRSSYSLYHAISSILMMLALLWLTVSIPYVFSAQNHLLSQKEQQSAPVHSQQEEEAATPLSSATEEKTPGSGNTLSEFLHEMEMLKQPSKNFTRYNKYSRLSFYNDFHGELLVPPPNC